MDDHLRSKRQTLFVESLHITSTYSGTLLQGDHPFGRPGGYVFGIGVLSPNAVIPVFPESLGPPDPQVYEKRVDEQLDAAKDRLASALPQIAAQARTDIDTRLVKTAPLVDPSAAGQLATRLVVIGALLGETQRSAARWSAGAAQFYGRDIWDTSAQDFISHAQAAGQLDHHDAAQLASRQWRESLAAAEHARKAAARVAVLTDLQSATQAELHTAVDQAHGEDPIGWQARIEAARPNADGLIAELPDFLRAQVTQQPQVQALVEPVQYFAAMQAHLEALLADLPPLPMAASVDSAFTEPPLGKPEMELLLQVVENDRNRGLNSSFSMARVAVLRNESIRHLQELAVRLQALGAGAAASQQRLSAHHAQQAALVAELEQLALAQRELQEQQAREHAEAAAAQLANTLQEQARLAALQAAEARLQAWRAMPGALVVGVPQLHGQAPALVAAGTGLTLLDTAALSLGAAIRAAIAALGTVVAGAAASAGTLLSGLAVGFIALLWPSSLAPSERRSALLMPLDTLPAPDQATLDAAAQSGQPVTLAYAATLRSDPDGLRVKVLAGSEPSPLSARVIDLTLNPQTGAYEALIDTPPRLIHVTPAVQPEGASTELPITEPLQPAEPGPSLELQGLSGNVTPGYEALDAELYILRYPASSGLPTLYLAVERPAVQLGETGTYADQARRSKKDGLDIDHIPSRKALEQHYFAQNHRLSRNALKALTDKGASLAIPREVHQKFSETYGGRSTKDKSAKDGNDLEAAVNSNINSLRDGLLEAGLSAEQIDTITADLHAINRENGHYK